MISKCGSRCLTGDIHDRARHLSCNQISSDFLRIPKISDTSSFSLSCSLSLTLYLTNADDRSNIDIEQSSEKSAEWILNQSNRTIWTYVSKSSGLTSRNGSKIAMAALLTRYWMGKWGWMASFVAFQSDKSMQTGTILEFYLNSFRSIAMNHRLIYFGNQLVQVFFGLTNSNYFGTELSQT